jgi:hypothetical protein
MGRSPLGIGLLVGFLDFSLNSTAAVDRVAVITRPLTDLGGIIAATRHGSLGAGTAPDVYFLCHLKDFLFEVRDVQKSRMFLQKV